MNESERLRAEELDAYLTALQAGRKPSSAQDLPASEAELAGALHQLAQAEQPSPQFLAQLGERLRERGRALAAPAYRPSPARGRFSMSNRFVLAAAGIGALALVVLLGLPALGRVLQPPTPPAQAGLVATSTPTALPAPTESGPAPSVTPAPTAAIVRPTTLPRLAALTGGSGGGGVAIARAHYELATALPESPAQMAVYQVQTPAAPSAAEATQLAERLGMRPNLYEGPSVFDGARELRFEPAGYTFHYRDARSSFYYNGHWYPAGELPSADQAVTAARGFLEGLGLLDDGFEVLPPRFPGAAVQFAPTLEGRWPVLPAAASVEVGGDGEVGDATYSRVDLQPAGDLAIISAEEAWRLLSAGQTGDRLWYRNYPPTHCNPRYWARASQVGQRGDLFGSPVVSQPLDGALGPRVTLGEMLLTGELAPLVEQLEAAHAKEQPLWLHVWGQVEQAGEALSLRVEGWEALATEPVPYMGTIRRQGDTASLIAGDGRTYALPDLPADLADGAVVFVEGGEVEGRLEWTLIQAAAPDAVEFCSPGGPVAGAVATVEQVDLVYYVPPDAGSATPSYAQPMWRFAGTMDNGLLFEVWVQAVVEAYLE